MATTMDSPLEASFRSLVHKIATKLTPQNCSSLTFLYNTSNYIKEHDIWGLEVMKELLSKRCFTHVQPQELEEAMSKIERQDLVELVRRYKKSEEFKLALKDEKSKAKNRNTDKKNVQVSPPHSKEHGLMASVAFMHAAQTVAQTRYFLKVATTEYEQKHKKEVAAIEKDFERLLKSINKAILAATETMPPMEPPPEVPSLELHQGTNPMLLCSPVSSGSAGLTESYSSSASSKSEEENPKEMDDNTGDSGYNGSGSDWKSVLPKLKDKKGNNNDPDYANPWAPVQETELQKTEYEKLTSETKDKPHHYAKYQK